MLSRVEGYDRRCSTAVRRAAQGDQPWVDAGDRDSCHAVWFELHEDLLSTLGLRRGEELLGEA